MRPQKKVHRRRCTECRVWFSPDPRAATVQQTCSPKCRREKRNRQAAERRACALEKFRAAERERQARCRAKKRALEATGPPSGPSLPPEIAARLEDVVAFALAAPSRAALSDALTSLASDLLGRTGS
jgi:hypothetical protein